MQGDSFTCKLIKAQRQLHRQKRTSCDKSVDSLQQTYQQADIRMRSHAWRATAC